MENLILTSAVGYDFTKIEVFIKSLRKFYFEEVAVLINKNQKDLKFFTDDYNVQLIETDIEAKKSYQQRFDFYYLYLQDKFENYNSIFLTDSRDVLFQENPFAFEYKSNLNFYLEDNIIENCKHNSNWIKKTAGKEAYEKIKKNRISCSGTVIGKSKDIFLYIKLMNENIKKYKYKKSFKEHVLFKNKYNGYDQGIHNFLIRNNFFPESYLYDNAEGNIATVNYYFPNLNFNSNHHLVNDQGRPYDAVHQYDRVTATKNFDNTLKDILN